MAADEEQQLDLFDNSSESRFNELSYSEQPQTEENDAEGREAQTLRALREPAARTPLVGDEEQEKVRARKHPEEASSCVAAQEPMKGSTSKTQVEPLLVSREAAGAGAGAGRTRAVARGMGSISQEGGFEPRAGSSAGSSVKGVAAANAPSTASLSTQVLPHIGFETKVSFDAQHELAKSRSSRFRPRLASARSPDSRVQGRVTQQLTITGVLVEEPRPIDFRLQAFAPRPPKRNTRESVRPERFGGQHLHLARARTDAHTRPRSRGDTQSPNLDDLELAHVPVVASRVARSNLFLDGADADGTGGFSFSASTGHTGTSTGTSKASSSTGLKPKSAISGLRSSTEKKARTARLEERPSFNARVRLSRPFTCKRLAATDERPGVQPYVSTRSYEFREV